MENSVFYLGCDKCRCQIEWKHRKEDGGIQYQIKISMGAHDKVLKSFRRITKYQSFFFEYLVELWTFQQLFVYCYKKWRKEDIRKWNHWKLNSTHVGIKLYISHVRMYMWHMNTYGCLCAGTCVIAYIWVLNWYVSINVHMHVYKYVKYMWIVVWCVLLIFDEWSSL